MLMMNPICAADMSILTRVRITELLFAFPNNTLVTRGLFALANAGEESVWECPECCQIMPLNMLGNVRNREQKKHGRRVRKSEFGAQRRS